MEIFSQEFCKEFQKEIAPWLESLEKMNKSLEDQISRNEKLFEEKSIITQELKLREGGEVNLEKNNFSRKNNDQLARDEQLSDEKFINDLTQESKLGRS